MASRLPVAPERIDDVARAALVCRPLAPAARGAVSGGCGRISMVITVADYRHT